MYKTEKLPSLTRISKIYIYNTKTKAYIDLELLLFSLLLNTEMPSSLLSSGDFLDGSFVFFFEDDDEDAVVVVKGGAASEEEEEEDEEEEEEEEEEEGGEEEAGF